MSNKITLRIVSKVTKCRLYPSTNPDTGMYPDHIREVDEYNKPILYDEDKRNVKNKLPIFPISKFVEVTDGKTFDLDNPQDKSDWEAIKFSEMIAPDRLAKDSKGNYLIDGDVTDYSDKARLGRAIIYIERPGVIAEVNISRKKLVHKAESYIYDADRETKDLWLKFLGSPMYGLHDAEVDEYLVNIAAKTPEKIINLATDSNTDLRLLFISAREKGVIMKKDGMFVYGDDVVLGFSEDSVIEWFKEPKNSAYIKAIRKDTFPNIKTKE